MRFAYMEYKKVGVKRAPTHLNAYFNLHIKIEIITWPIRIFYREHVLKVSNV